MINLIAAGEKNLGTLQAPSQAFAPTGTGAEAGGNILARFMSTFLGFLTTLAGLMFLIYFIIAALSWITAGGDKGKIEHARSSMINAAIGLIIVIAAYSIAGIVGGVVGLNILDPVSVLKQIAPGGTK